MKTAGMDLEKLKTEGTALLNELMELAQKGRETVVALQKREEYTDKYKQEKIRELHETAVGAARETLAKVRQLVEDHAREVIEKGIERVPDNDAAYFARKTYLLTKAQVALGGLSGRALIERFAELARKQPDVAREAREIVRAQLNTGSPDDLLRLQEYRRILGEVAPELAAAERAEAQLAKFEESARLYEGRTLSTVSEILTGAMTANPAAPAALFEKVLSMMVEV